MSAHIACVLLTTKPGWTSTASSASGVASAWKCRGIRWGLVFSHALFGLFYMGTVTIAQFGSQLHVNRVVRWCCM